MQEPGGAAGGRGAGLRRLRHRRRPSTQWDDFKGVDLKGKTLLMMNNDPEDDPALFAGKTRLWYGRWDYKYEQAAKLGAAGAIIIHTTPSRRLPVAGRADLLDGRAVRAARHRRAARCR